MPTVAVCHHPIAQQEFRRLESSLGAARDRAELLGGMMGDTAPLLGVQVRARSSAPHFPCAPQIAISATRRPSATNQPNATTDPPNANLPPTKVHTASGALLRERTQLAASSNYVDDMLAQAQSVTRSLMEQRRVFDNVQVGGWAAAASA